MPILSEPRIVTVGTALTTLLEYDGGEFIGIQIENGATAFNDFVIQAKIGSTSSWVTIPYGNNIGTPGVAYSAQTLTSLGSNTSAILIVSGEYFDAIRCLASVASGTSVVRVFYR